MSDSQKTQTEKGMEKYFFRASAEDFKKIPGSPIAYFIPINAIDLFVSHDSLGSVSRITNGLFTCDNATFIRYWFEVENQDIDYKCSSLSKTNLSWYPYNKGGAYRKHYGNSGTVVYFFNNGKKVREFRVARGQSYSTPGEDYYFQKSISWSFVSSSYFGARAYPEGFIFDIAGSSIFCDPSDYFHILGFLVSKPCDYFLRSTNPTLNYQVGNIRNLPFKKCADSQIVQKNIAYSKTDWDSYETSWDFETLPLLDAEFREPTLRATYQKLREHWRGMTLEMQRLEEENNRIFIDAYGLEEELTPEVPLEEITLTCNPHYRYRLSKKWDDASQEEREDELERRLLQDTVQELISYAVGCIFGRYSLDKPGLILANQGDSLEEYLAQIPEPTFPIVEDNVIPMISGDWFGSDMVERFREFLKLTFGEEHYEENLRFIEEALNIKGRRNYNIHTYFEREFYDDHIRRYKKRPIYWLFSSPKGSFNALIYMHRYRPDTISVVLNDYLREFQMKLASRRDHLEEIRDDPNTADRDKTRARKEIEEVTKIIVELEDYERDVLYPLATKRVAIDLDDGVKVNYAKFSGALKKVRGL